jgi:hypothetical protein
MDKRIVLASSNLFHEKDNRLIIPLLVGKLDENLKESHNLASERCWCTTANVARALRVPAAV